MEDCLLLGWKRFLIPLGISQYRLAKELDIPQTRISGIINGSRRIEPFAEHQLVRYSLNSVATAFVMAAG